jgi:hypothetical protein
VTEGGIDLDRLMADLKRRVAARRAAGEYDERLFDVPFDEDLPGGAGELVRLRMETAYSSKPLVGRAITFGKRVQIRLLFHFLNDVVTQTNAALTTMRANLDAEERAREALEDRVRELETALAAARASEPPPGG